MRETEATLETDDETSAEKVFLIRKELVPRSLSLSKLINCSKMHEFIEEEKGSHFERVVKVFIEQLFFPVVSIKIVI